MKRSAPTTAALIAAGLLVAGCSSDGQEAKEGDPKAALLTAARSYQEAVNRQDWQDACARSTARLRDGSVKECAAEHTEESPSPEPSTSSPSFEPPTYADGSTPDPVPSSSPTGPERADTGAVSAQADDVVKVPAVDDHPGGYGVLIAYSVKWPGEDATTSRKALRLVRESGKWLVDQHEDVQEGDMGHGSPVRAALSGE